MAEFLSYLPLYVSYLFIGLGILILLLAISNRIVFYYDTRDFVFSFIQGFIIFLVAYLFITSPNNYPGILNAENLHEKIIAGALVLSLFIGFVICLKYTLSKSIQFNGLAFGLAIYFYKILIGSIFAFTILGKFANYTDSKKSTHASRASAIAILILLSWILSKLINGSTIEQKKHDLGGQ